MENYKALWTRLQKDEKGDKEVDMARMTETETQAGIERDMLSVHAVRATHQRLPGIARGVVQRELPLGLPNHSAVVECVGSCSDHTLERTCSYHSIVRQANQ